MNEQESLSDWEQDFINYVRTTRGPCPDDDTLVAYHEERLPPDRAEQVEAHVRLCGTCQVAIEMLKRFDACVAGDLPEPPPDWPEVEKRSRERFYAFLKQRRASLPERQSFWEKLRGVVLHPAVAYLLLAALAYPAYRGLFGKPEVVKEVVREPKFIEVEKPGLDIATLSTFEPRPADRAAVQGPGVVRLAKDERFFALSFFVPISERPEFVYDVEIRNSQGQLVASEKAARPQDELGNFLLVCRRELFLPGTYELQVKEVNKTTQAVRRTFRFSFSVSQVK